MQWVGRCRVELLPTTPNWPLPYHHKLVFKGLNGYVDETSGRNDGAGGSARRVDNLQVWEVISPALEGAHMVHAEETTPAERHADPGTDLGSWKVFDNILGWVGHPGVTE